ncbi:MAG: hypothetical protein HWN66_00555 [Candidatus Helarchaeota archaeon]|nr:hypothetical protein [Candidatus Helarchaeota archaeon]
MLNVKFASESDPETDVSLSFFAAERILGEVIFSERFLFDIGKLIQQKGIYHLNETLKDVKLPSGQLLGGQFVFIVAKSEKENLDFGVLFNRLESGGYHISGLWPRDFAEICRSDPEIFEFLMFRLINTPDFFSKVTLYQTLGMKLPKMEIKPPTVEMKPPAVPKITPAAPAAAAEVKAAVKPTGVEVTPTTVPPKVEFRPPEAAKVEVPPDLLEGRCPFCKAAIPEPRLKVLQRGNNTFCPKCLKILKGFTAPVEVSAVSEVSVTETTKNELAELVKQAEQAVQRKDYSQAASNYRIAAQKANLLNDSSYASELESKAEECSLNLRSTKIQELMKSADDYFRQKSYDTAIKEYKIAVDLAKRIKDNELLNTINTRIRKCAELIVTEKVEGFINQADQLLQEERYDEAKQNYIQALELERKIGEKETILLLEQKISDCENFPLKKKLKEASSRAEKQFKIDNFDEASQLYREAASCASQLRDREAQSFFEQKIEECRTTPLKRKIQELVRTAEEQFQSQNFDAATNTYRSALNFATELADKALVRELEDKIIQSSMGESELKLQNVLQDANNKFAQKDYINAKRGYQEAVSIAKQMQKSDSAKTFEEKAKACDTKINIDKTIQEAQTNYQSKNFEMALKLYNDVRKLAQGINDEETIKIAVAQVREIQQVMMKESLSNFISKADLLISEQNFEGAKEKLEQANKLATKMNDTATIQEISTKFAQCEAGIKAALQAKIEPTGFLCPFCDFPLPEKVVKNLKKGYNDQCPNCNKTLGKRALEL